jgi:hypothetical protein
MQHPGIMGRVLCRGTVEEVERVTRFTLFREGTTMTTAAKSTWALMAILFMACSASAAGKVELYRVPGENRIDVTIDGREFTSYWWHPTLFKPVLYPVRTAKGTTVTRNYPPLPNEAADHPHHIGIWFNYGNVNGLDFWNNSEAIAPDKKAGYGTIRHRGITTMKSGAQGVLGVTCDWVDHEGKVLLVEDTTFTFRGEGNLRIIDRATRLTAKADVEFQDNKEGCMAIRVTTPLQLPSSVKKSTFTDAHGVTTEVAGGEGANGNYLSSEGKEGDGVWGTRARWMKLYGRFGDENVDVVMIDHPKNPGYPTHWHARNYGLFAANTLGQKALSDGKLELNYRLAKGESGHFNYRILIGCGPTLSVDKIEAAFKEFAAQP